MVAVLCLLVAASRRADATPGDAQAGAACAKTDGRSSGVTCPSPLGAGVKTKREYCDVLTGRDPKEGIIIKLPPHRGP